MLLFVEALALELLFFIFIEKFKISVCTLPFQEISRKGVKKQKCGFSVATGDLKTVVNSDVVLDKIAGIQGGTLGTPGVSLVELFDKPGETVCCVKNGQLWLKRRI